MYIYSKQWAFKKTFVRGEKKCLEVSWPCRIFWKIKSTIRGHNFLQSHLFITISIIFFHEAGGPLGSFLSSFTGCDQNIAVNWLLLIFFKNKFVREKIYFIFEFLFFKLFPKVFFIHGYKIYLWITKIRYKDHLIHKRRLKKYIQNSKIVVQTPNKISRKEDKIYFIWLKYWNWDSLY